MSATEIKPIRTERDCEAALAEIQLLWDAKADTPGGDRLDVLANLGPLTSDGTPSVEVRVRVAFEHAPRATILVTASCAALAGLIGWGRIEPNSARAGG